MYIALLQIARFYLFFLNMPYVGNGNRFRGYTRQSSPFKESKKYGNGKEEALFTSCHCC